MDNVQSRDYDRLLVENVTEKYAIIILSNYIQSKFDRCKSNSDDQTPNCVIGCAKQLQYNATIAGQLAGDRAQLRYDKALAFTLGR